MNDTRITKQVRVSAPGKIHLMGEHAVVYGKPAVLAAINLRLTVTMTASETGVTSVDTTESPDYILYARQTAIDMYGITKPEPAAITVRSEIPPGYHLGSSAAAAVATVGAITTYYGRKWDSGEINRIAYEVEKKIHGNPSGGDPATCVAGGLVWFRKEMEFLRTIEHLPFIPKANLSHFFLINTGRPKETTGEMVAGVRSRFEIRGLWFEKLFTLNEVQTRRVAVSLKEGNEEELMDAIRIGERTLEKMGVVSRRAAMLIRRIENIGGAAKILGGGGRIGPVGFILCYHPNPPAVEQVVRPLGYLIQQIVLGEEGVRVEYRE